MAEPNDVHMSTAMPAVDESTARAVRVPRPAEDTHFGSGFKGLAGAFQQPSRPKPCQTTTSDMVEQKHPSAAAKPASMTDTNVKPTKPAADAACAQQQKAIPQAQQDASKACDQAWQNLYALFESWGEERGEIKRDDATTALDAALNKLIDSIAAYAVMDHKHVKQADVKEALVLFVFRQPKAGPVLDGFFDERWTQHPMLGWMAPQRSTREQSVLFGRVFSELLQFKTDPQTYDWFRCYHGPQTPPIDAMAAKWHGTKETERALNGKLYTIRRWLLYQFADSR